MGDLQATVEFLVELYKFYNVDLFIRGYYQFRLSFKPPKSSHAIQVEVCNGHGEGGAFSLFPAYITNDGQTAVSRTFNIYYKDEEVLLKDVFLFRVHLLIDSTKAADCIDKAALEMTVDVHFTDQAVKESNYRLLPLVTSRTLKFHFSCFNGLHHQVPLLFDYYYFSVLDMIVHANVVSLGLPNWSILKPIKTGWFGKSAATSRSSTPLFFSTLFGNRPLASQFYSDVSLRYAVTNTNSISREHFQKASAVHRNLCAILAMAHAQLLNYFDKMMNYLDKKQKIKLAEKLDPADLVEGLCKKLETLQSCEEVFDEMCSDMSVLNNELALLWLQFQESFTLNDQIRPLLREQHHLERMMHFSEAFFIHELPWKSLLNVTDSSFQKHLNMGQCVKSSRYLSIIPAVTIECAEVDGDSSSTPIFFEDCYVNKKDKSPENLYAVHVHGEDDVLEHKPLSFGILNKAFNDLSPPVTDTTDSSDHDLDTKDVWVDIKASQESTDIVARVPHAEQDNTRDECRVTEDIEDNKGLEGIDDGINGHTTSLQNLDGETSINDSVTVNDVKNINSSPIKSDNVSPKTLLECSMERVKENTETQEELKRNLCNTEDIEEHCRTIQDTNEHEVRDESDVIPVIETSTDDEAKNINSKVESANSSFMRDSKEVSAVDSAISTVSLENKSETDIDSVVTLSEEDKGPSSQNHEAQDCLRASEDCTQNTDNEPTTSNSLLPNSNSEVSFENTDVVENSCSTDVAEGKDVPCSEDTEQTSTSSVAFCSSSPEETSQKTSSMTDVETRKTIVSDIAEVVPIDKNDSSISVRETEPYGTNLVESKPFDGKYVNSTKGEPESVPGDGNISQEQEQEKDLCASGGEPNHNAMDEVYDNSDETIIEEPVHSNLAYLFERHSSGNVIGASSSLLTDDALESGKLINGARDDSDEVPKRRNTARVNASKPASNSVFYKRLSPEECFGELDLQTKKVSVRQLETVTLSPNSPAEVVSCFCGGKSVGKLSSPYKPVSENDATNLMLQKAKQDVISRMNYCGTIYSDFTKEFIVQPYFMNTKPDLSLESVHFVVCVHGLEGNSGDLRLVRCFLEMALPTTKFEFLMSEVNQDNTFATFEKQTEKLVSEILHHMEAYRISPSRISFIGHSLGNIIIRSALQHPILEPYVELFHTFLSLSGPHLGMVHHTSSLVSTGMWLLQKWKKSDSLLQLSLNDSTDMRDTFIYKLSKKKGLEYFTNVLLVSSVQDHYVPFHSSRIELPKSSKSNSQEYTVYREMMENLLTPLLSQPNRTLVRYSVYHCLPSSTNTFIGRAAHIAMLDSELFIEKLICTSAAKYFL